MIEIVDRDDYLIIPKEYPPGSSAVSKVLTENIYIENLKKGTILKYRSIKNTEKETVSGNDIQVHIGFQPRNITEFNEQTVLEEQGFTVLAEFFVDEFRGGSHDLYCFSKYRGEQVNKNGTDIFHDLMRSLEITAEKLDGKKHKVNFLSEPISIDVLNSPNSIQEFLAVIDTFFDTDYATLYDIAEKKANYKFSVNGQTSKSLMLVTSHEQK